MIFSSLTFICIFLPITYILHTIIPSIKVKNIILVIASLLFYAYGEPVYVLLMLLSTIINYLSAFLIDKYKSHKKPILILNVILNIGILCVFKYTGFIVTSINSITGIGLKIPEISLPIGISFFTFQALSYVIDVYYDRVDMQRNYLKVLLYISFFPQLIAGPIVKYRDISAEIDNRSCNASETAVGLRRFICGLAKKVIIANTMGTVADAIYDIVPNEAGALAAWLGAIAYMLQIYYDFSGYSDMAIGLGKMFGFHFKENFIYPYGATSIQDFWRKWHISLSSWFKEYVYIPLGGNRKGKARTCLNRIIVFLLTGLWHGASWTFVIWGLFHGFFLLLEEVVPIKKLPKFIGQVYSFIVVCIGFVIFRADTISYAGQMIKTMFTGFNVQNIIAYEQLTPWFIFCLVLAVIGMAPIRGLADKIRTGIYAGDAVSRKWRYADRILYIAAFVLLGWCMLRLSGNTYNPFIYFRF